MNKREFLRSVFEKYALNKDEDIYVLKHGAKSTVVITKTGIQKIASKEQLTYDFHTVVCQPDYCAIKCVVRDKDGKPLAVSYGSAEEANVKNSGKYYLEMAEKRAKARAVLIAIDAHGYLYSEDEADDFKKGSNG